MTMPDLKKHHWQFLCIC